MCTTITAPLTTKGVFVTREVFRGPVGFWYPHVEAHRLTAGRQQVLFHKLWSYSLGQKKQPPSGAARLTGACSAT